MKHRNKNSRSCCKEGANKDMANRLRKTTRNGNRKSKRNQKIQISEARVAGPTQYIFCAILNTSLNLNRGAVAAQIAGGLISLYSTLDHDQIKYHYIDNWMRNGRKIIILKGYDHKHLRHLEAELKFIAIGCHAVRQTWGRNRSIAVLTVFGQREDLEDVFDGLVYLR